MRDRQFKLIAPAKVYIQLVSLPWKQLLLNGNSMVKKRFTVQLILDFEALLMHSLSLPPFLYLWYSLIFTHHKHMSPSLPSNQFRRHPANEPAAAIKTNRRITNILFVLNLNHMFSCMHWHSIAVTSAHCPAGSFVIADASRILLLFDLVLWKLVFAIVNYYQIVGPVMCLRQQHEFSLVLGPGFIW